MYFWGDPKKFAGIIKSYRNSWKGWNNGGKVGKKDESEYRVRRISLLSSHLILVVTVFHHFTTPSFLTSSVNLSLFLLLWSLQNRIPLPGRILKPALNGSVNLQAR
jgi:hypothetical protein